MNTSSSRMVPEAATFRCCFLRADNAVGLTVFCQEGTLNHSRHRPVKPESGLHLILTEQDLFGVDMEDVEVEEGAIHKALQQIRRSSTFCCPFTTKTNFTSDLPVSPISIKGNADLESGVMLLHRVAPLFCSWLLQKLTVEADTDVHNAEARVQRV